MSQKTFVINFRRPEENFPFRESTRFVLFQLSSPLQYRHRFRVISSSVYLSIKICFPMHIYVFPISLIVQTYKQLAFYQSRCNKALEEQRLPPLLENLSRFRKYSNMGVSAIRDRVSQTFSSNWSVESIQR